MCHSFSQPTSTLNFSERQDCSYRHERPAHRLADQQRRWRWRRRHRPGHQDRDDEANTVGPFLVTLKLAAAKNSSPNVGLDNVTDNGTTARDGVEDGKLESCCTPEDYRGGAALRVRSQEAALARGRRRYPTEAAFSIKLKQIHLNRENRVSFVLNEPAYRTLIIHVRSL